MRFPKTVQQRVAGTASLELLLALPIVLVLGLLTLQLLLAYQAHRAWTYALFEAARHASVHRATLAAAGEGLARGWAPMLAQRPGEPQDELLRRARGYVELGVGNRWIQLTRLAPTAAAFADWSEQELDDNGRTVSGVQVIPNDNLGHRRLQQQPASGAADHLYGEPIGAASGTSLVDATVLKLELRVGIPLVVPLAGRFLAATLSLIDGCPQAAIFQFGPAFNGRSDSTPVVGVPAQHWRCAFYGGMGDHGQPHPRLPIRLTAITRMHSPIEISDQAQGTRQ